MVQPIYHPAPGVYRTLAFNVFLTFVYGKSAGSEIAIGDWMRFLLDSGEQARKRGDAWVRSISGRVVALDMLEPGEIQGVGLDKLKLGPLLKSKVAVLRRA